MANTKKHHVQPRNRLFPAQRVLQVSASFVLSQHRFSRAGIIMILLLAFVSGFASDKTAQISQKIGAFFLFARVVVVFFFSQTLFHAIYSLHLGCFISNLRAVQAGVVSDLLTWCCLDSLSISRDLFSALWMDLVNNLLSAVCCLDSGAGSVRRGLLSCTLEVLIFNSPVDSGLGVLARDLIPPPPNFCFLEPGASPDSVSRDLVYSLHLGCFCFLTYRLTRSARQTLFHAISLCTPDVLLSNLPLDSYYGFFDRPDSVSRGYLLHL
jgi:hypothetical protein